MRQAITTTTHGPTNHHGTRIGVRCDAGRIVVPWDHALDAGANHTAAARQLAQKLAAAHGYGWAGTWIGGRRPTPTASTAHDAGYVYVNITATAYGSTEPPLPPADDLAAGVFTIAAEQAAPRMDGTHPKQPRKRARGR